MKCSDPQPNAAAVRAAASIGIVGEPRTALERIALEYRVIVGPARDLGEVRVVRPRFQEGMMRRYGRRLRSNAIDLRAEKGRLATPGDCITAGRNRPAKSLSDVRRASAPARRRSAS
ncbi:MULTISPECIES: hypothetical protein [Burkholderia]|uniref:hypothetical protein n=1 Tax=Burkholderia TaxID=32008 RepID=UPI00158B7AC1|nr:hypothetical protein [Burkholderia ambifaria]